jgi:hypothetical protein
MKMIDGAASLALANRSRTRGAPTPTIASMNSEAEIEKTLRAPRPLRPERATFCRCPARRTAARLGACAHPGRPYRSGSRRKSTISVSSPLASSMPPTSAKSNPDRRRVNPPGLGATEIAQRPARSGAGRAPHEQDDHADANQGQQRRALCRRGPLTRGWAPGRTSSAELRLKARGVNTNHTNGRERWGGRRAGGSGIPRPSGAGATRHPCWSRGIRASRLCTVQNLVMPRIILHCVVVHGRDPLRRLELTTRGTRVDQMRCAGCRRARITPRPT